MILLFVMKIIIPLCIEMAINIYIYIYLSHTFCFSSFDKRCSVIRATILRVMASHICANCLNILMMKAYDAAISIAQCITTLET